MKRSDITSKTLLAHRRNKYGTYRPMVVIDTNTLWTRRKQLNSAHMVLTPAPEKTRYQSGNFHTREVGVLVIGIDEWSHSESGDLVDAMRQAIDLIPEKLTEETIAGLASKLPKHLTVRLVNNTQLQGDWDEVNARQQETDRREKEIRKAHQAIRKANDDRFQTILTALKDRGLDLGPFPAHHTDGHVRVSLDLLATLLGLDDKPEKTA